MQIKRDSISTMTQQINEHFFSKNQLFYLLAQYVSFILQEIQTDV